MTDKPMAVIYGEKDYGNAITVRCPYPGCNARIKVQEQGRICSPEKLRHLWCRGNYPERHWHITCWACGLRLIGVHKPPENTEPKAPIDMPVDELEKLWKQ